MGDNNRLVAVSTTDGKQWSHTTLFLLVALGLAPFDSTTREGSRLGGQRVQHHQWLLFHQRLMAIVKRPGKMSIALGDLEAWDLGRDCPMAWLSVLVGSALRFHPQSMMSATGNCFLARSTRPYPLEWHAMASPHWWRQIAHRNM